MTIEYEANLETRSDIAALCRALHAAMLETGLLELGTLRVRALRCTDYAVADLLPDNSFADLRLRIAAVFMIYSLNGERGTSPSRLLVEASIYHKFTAMVTEKAKRIVVGHPLDPKTVVGPLIHPLHKAKVLDYIEIGKAEGATVAAVGAKFAGQGGGCYVSPTLFTDATNQMRIAQEEIFGPVLTAIPFTDEADALRIANDVQYGLTAYLWTNDITRAFRFTDALEAGMVWVNSENIRHLPSPFGGIKNSGIGRDGAQWSFDFYMETKNIAFDTMPHAIPKLGG